MIYNTSQGMRQRIIIGKDSPTIAIATQVLGGEETCSPYLPYSTELLFVAITPSVVCSYTLCIVLYHKEVMLFGYLHNHLHIGRATI